MMKEKGRSLAILGSTGSIGCQALDIARRFNIKVEALAARTDVDTLEMQIREFAPRYVSLVSESAAKDLSERTRDLDLRIFTGEESACEMIEELSSDMLLNSVVGNAGLRPTLAAIDKGMDIALANKETLVTGGELVMKNVKEKGVSLLPVDSEHCAIHQCLRSGERDELSKLVLTASGGPFFGKNRDALTSVTLEQTLAHPTWNMGKKITVDSATLMNKGFEIIEAAHLFGVDVSDIDVVIHRESIIHSMVGYRDGSVISQMGVPDMRTCISYALFGARRMPDVSRAPDLTAIARLSFFDVDERTFILLPLAKEAFSFGGTVPAILNAANDEAVRLFLEKKIKFTDIMDLVSETVHKYSKSRSRDAYNGRLPDIDDISESAELAVMYLRDLAQFS